MVLGVLLIKTSSNLLNLKEPKGDFEKHQVTPSNTNVTNENEDHFGSSIWKLRSWQADGEPKKISFNLLHSIDFNFLKTYHGC